MGAPSRDMGRFVSLSYPAETTRKRLHRWRGWDAKGHTLGVVEAVSEPAAVRQFLDAFPGTLDVVTPAFRGTEVTL